MKMSEQQLHDIRKQIIEGHLRYFSFVDAYQELQPAMLLYFDCFPVMAVKEADWSLFDDIL